MLAKKSYKADLEHHRVLFFELGLVVSLFLALVAVEWNFSGDGTLPLGNFSTVVDDITEIIPTSQMESPAVEVKTPVISADELRIVPNKILLDNTLFIESEDNAKAAADIIPYTSAATQDVVDDSNEPFYVVEKMPTFGKGGIDEFKKYVMSNVVYSEYASSNDIFGTVYVEFVVGKAGRIEDIKVVRSVDPSLDNEVVRVLKSAPNWVPGYQRSNAVRVKFTLPIKFTLNR